jgi:hypothetical protein
MIGTAWHRPAVHSLTFKHVHNNGVGNACLNNAAHIGSAIFVEMFTAEHMNNTFMDIVGSELRH